MGRGHAAERVPVSDESSGPRKRTLAGESVKRDYPASGVVRGRFVLKPKEDVTQEKTRVVPPPLPKAPASVREYTYKGKYALKPTEEEKRKAFLKEHPRLSRGKTYYSKERRANLSAHFEDEPEEHGLAADLRDHQEVIPDKYLRSLEGLTPAQKKVRIDAWYKRFEEQKTRMAGDYASASEGSVNEVKRKEALNVPAEVEKIRAQIARARGSSRQEEEVVELPQEHLEEIHEKGSSSTSLRYIARIWKKVTGFFGGK